MKESIIQEPVNFDNMTDSGEKALAQLSIIKQCLENFIRLKLALDSKVNIREAMQLKRENNEIV